MFSTYRPEDVTILLKDITGQVKPMGTRERERLIQGGRHYSEMLPIEYEPTEKYLKAYYDALGRYARITAEATASVSEKIYGQKGKDAVLVSLARAGTPIGILIRPGETFAIIGATNSTYSCFDRTSGRSFS